MPTCCTRCIAMCSAAVGTATAPTTPQPQRYGAPLLPRAGAAGVLRARRPRRHARLRAPPAHRLQRRSGVPRGVLQHARHPLRVAVPAVCLVERVVCRQPSSVAGGAGGASGGVNGSTGSRAMAATLAGRRPRGIGRADALGGRLVVGGGARCGPHATDTSPVCGACRATAAAMASAGGAHRSGMAGVDIDGTALPDRATQHSPVVGDVGQRPRHPRIPVARRRCVVCGDDRRGITPGRGVDGAAVLARAHRCPALRPVHCAHILYAAASGHRGVGVSARRHRVQRYGNVADGAHPRHAEGATHTPDGDDGAPAAPLAPGTQVARTVASDSAAAAQRRWPHMGAPVAAASRRAAPVHAAGVLVVDSPGATHSDHAQRGGGVGHRHHLGAAIRVELVCNLGHVALSHRRAFFALIPPRRRRRRRRR
eukprot:ctg_372.g234